MKRFIAMLLILSFLVVVPCTNASAKSKKDTGPSNYYLDNYSDRAIRNIIYTLMYQSFPKAGQTTEDYTTLLKLRFPRRAYNSTRIKEVSKTTWDALDGLMDVYDLTDTTWSRDQLLYISINFNNALNNSDNEFVPSKNDYRYNTLSLFIKEESKAMSLYKLLASDMENYYGTVKIDTLEELPETTILTVTTNTVDNGTDQDTAVMYVLLPDETVDGYVFILNFYEPNAIDFPGELAYDLFYPTSVKNAFKVKSVKVESTKKGTVKVTYDNAKSFAKTFAAMMEDESTADIIYTIEYADNKEFTNSTSIKTRALSKNIKGLEKGTTYYFRVTAEINTENYRYLCELDKATIKKATIKK